MSIKLLIFFFFTVITTQSLATSTKGLKLNEWQNLLYFKDNNFLISDKSFFLGPSIMNPKREYFLSLEKILNPTFFCRFPARAFYLSHLKHIELNFKKCHKLQSFIEKVPSEQISLIFASENVLNPVSMMGHVYLELTGKDKSGNLKNHAISFFTNTENESLFQILFTGSKGQYALTPGLPLRQKYLYNEERNIWKYQLNLNSFRKKLLIYHLFELKNIEFKYLFTSFNCASFFKQILKITYPSFKPKEQTWDTPVELVKLIKKHNMVKSIDVYLANKWKAKALFFENLVSKKSLLKIKSENYLTKGKVSLKNKKEQYAYLELARSFNHENFIKGNLAEDKFKIIDKKLFSLKKKLAPNYSFDLSNYKKPSERRSYGHLLTGIFKNNEQLLPRINFMPIDHSISDYLRSYLNESELKVLEIEMRGTNKNSVQLEKVNIFEVMNLNPDDPLYDGLSTRFQFGWLRHFDYNLDLQKTLQMRFQLGKTYRLSTNLDAYFLTGTKLLTNYKKLINPEVSLGLILRQILKTKTIFEFTSQFQNEKFKENLNIFELKESISIGDDYQVLIEYTNFQNKNEGSSQEASFNILKYF